MLWGLGVAAVLLRVALAFYCPTPFGYVYDYYYEAIELFWKTGRLPIASDCWQCYHPPMFYLLGLPFYAAGRWLTASLESSPEWGLRFLSLMPLAAGAITAIYSAQACRSTGCRSRPLHCRRRARPRLSVSVHQFVPLPRATSSSRRS